MLNGAVKEMQNKVFIQLYSMDRPGVWVTYHTMLKRNSYFFLHSGLGGQWQAAIISYYDSDVEVNKYTEHTFTVC